MVIGGVQHGGSQGGGDSSGGYDARVQVCACAFESTSACTRARACVCVRVHACVMVVCSGGRRWWWQESVRARGGGVDISATDLIVSLRALANLDEDFPQRSLECFDL